MIDNLSIAVHAFARRILSSFSVDETLLPRCVNLSTNFKCSQLTVEMVSFRLKLMYFVLFAFTWRQMSPGYSAEIRLGQEALDHLHSSRLL